MYSHDSYQMPCQYSEHHTVLGSISFNLLSSQNLLHVTCMFTVPYKHV